MEGRQSYIQRHESLTHHDVKGEDAGDVHGGKQDDEVGQQTAGGGEQRTRRSVCLGGIVGPVDVAAAVHLEWSNGEIDAIQPPQSD